MLIRDQFFDPTFIEAMSSEFREGLPMELQYSDDLVLIAKTEELLVGKIQ